MAETTFVATPKSRWKKFVLVFGAIALSVFAFLTWYKLHYSMEVAEPFEIEAPNATHRVLIATQGSDFKNAVVDGVVKVLRERLISIRGIDVTEISTVNVDDWSVIVILHTWESWEPQVDAKLFLERHPNTGKVVVLTTSCGGGSSMDGVDAITSASKMVDAPKHADEIVRRVDLLLKQPVR